MDEFAGGCVGEREGRGRGAGLENAVFNAGGEELGDGALGEGEALGLDESAGVLRDAVELVLQRCVGRVIERSSHDSIIAAASRKRCGLRYMLEVTAAPE